ncbi:SoxR reducing system RseC family protein [bacterium]|nr:SoxR reducing system RseC family protein [bacterium]
MREIGRVATVKHDAAVVSMPMSGACERCGVCMVAGDGRNVLLLAKNEVEAVEGDYVEIEISPGRVIAAAFIIYMIPVFLTIAGFVVGHWLSAGDESSTLPIVLAVAFLISSFVGVALYDARLRKVERHEARIIRRLSDDEIREHEHHVQTVTMGE